MLRFIRHSCALYACLALSTFGLTGCGDSSVGTAGTGGSGGAAAMGGTGGEAGFGGQGGVGAAGGTGGIDAPKDQEILLVGGFMSELYTELSLHLEDGLNTALRDTARVLNVHIDLPLNQSIDIAIGDTIANALPRISLPLQPGGFISFHTQEAHFDLTQEPGFPGERIDYQNISDVSPAFNSGESVTHNAAAILQFLRSSEKQIVIVSHSKGGLDTLEALLQAPELWGDTVVGWVALQAPFHGTPIADPSPSNLSDLLLSAVGGNGQSLDDLKSGTRAAYMATNAARIEELTDSIPVISAYSTYEASRTVTGFVNSFASGIINTGLVSQITQIVVNNYWDTPLDIPGVINRSTTSAVNLIRQRISNALSSAIATVGLMDLTNAYMSSIAGVPNDGLVPRDSTELPFPAIHRELSLGDHASPVMDVDPLKNFWTAEHRNTVTLGLIEEMRALAGERSPANAPQERP
ncbi:MAG: hypothetical protein WCE62_11515 [Polyangiales bacterium]